MQEKLEPLIDKSMKDLEFSTELINLNRLILMIKQLNTYLK